MAKRVLVLHSGGMDSTTCLYKALDEGADVISVGIEYGQKLAVEMLFAGRQCASKGIARDIINVSWQKPDRPIPTGRSLSEMRSSVSPAFLPARNVVFLSLACAHSAGVVADEVHIGLNCVDFSGYPDCTPQFFDAFKTMIEIASPGGARIVAPLLQMSKPEIARLARSLGIGEHDTWSCYQPRVTDGAITPCHTCDACRIHDFAWRAID